MKIMIRWFSYMFNLYCHALGLSLFVAALLSIIFNINDATVAVIVIFGSLATFAVRLFFQYVDGKIDHMFVEV